MKKRKYKPAVVVRNLKDDFGLEEDINLEFWKDPSRKVALGLLFIIGRARGDESEDIDEAEWKQLDKEYYEMVSNLIVDSDIEGLDFSTPETTEASFDAEFLPWGILHKAVIAYLSELTTENENLKNVLRRVSKRLQEQDQVSNSGEDNETKETEKQESLSPSTSE